MGPLGVVGREPRVGDLADLLEGVEEIGVEDLFPNAAVEPLDKGVLIGLPRLDMLDRDALPRTTRRKPPRSARAHCRRAPGRAGRTAE